MREINLAGVQYRVTGDIIKKAVSPWNAKIASGSREYSDFSQASLEEYHDFRGGIGLESELPDKSDRLWWSEGVDVSTPRSAVLGPLVNTAQYDTWEDTHVYALLNFVVPSPLGVQVYECTTAGTSGGTQPTWDTTPGNTTNDGTVVWTCRNYLATVKIVDFQSATYFIQNSRILKWDGTNLDCVDNTFASPIDVIVVQDATDEYLIVSSASAALYTTDGTTWSTLTSAPGGYMASLNNRLFFISTDGKTVTYSGYNDIDTFSPAYSSPTGYNDPLAGWADEASAYDNNVATDALCVIPATSWGSYLELTITEAYFDRIRFYAEYLATTLTQIDVDVYYDHTWYNLYEGGYANETLEVKLLGSSEKISKCRVRFYNTNAGAQTAHLGEIYFGNGGGSFTLVGDFGTVYKFFEGKLLSDGEPALYFLGTRGLFSIDVATERAYQQEVEYPPLTYAGHAGMYWNANLWIATGYGILKISPSMASHIGPDQDDGLPSGYLGYVYDMDAVNNWLVFCVNGGTTDKSSIFKRNSSLGGNLQVYTSAAVDRAIPCIHHSPSSLYTNGRLWFGEGTAIKYMMFPDTTSNAKQIATYEYVAMSDKMKLPILRKLAAISKTALGVAAITKSSTGTERIKVYYGLNGAAPTTELGDFISSPRSTILTFGSGLGTAFYTIQLAVRLQRTTTGETPEVKSPELESLLFYYLPTPATINGWTFHILATDDNAEAIITALEAIRDTNTLVAFYPTGDTAKTSYNVKLTTMPLRFYVENMKTRQGYIEVDVQQIFNG